MTTFTSKPKMLSDGALAALRQAWDRGNRRVVCPRCMGGSTAEHCMSLFAVGNDTGAGNGAVLATCHRAACGVGTVVVYGDGKTRAYDTTEHAKQAKKMPPMTYYNLKSKAHDELLSKYKFEFDKHVVQNYIKQNSKGYIIPMFDSAGIQQGCIVKPFVSHGPKSLTYLSNPEYSGLCWFRPASDIANPEVMVVEDCISAIALRSMGLCAVSLNGTHLNRARVDELLDHKWRIILMLDADATRKAIQYRQMYGPDVVRVIRLQEDIKDMERGEVSLLLAREEVYQAE